jgi:hypothetical protein
VINGTFSLTDLASIFLQIRSTFRKEDKKNEMNSKKIRCDFRVYFSWSRIFVRTNFLNFHLNFKVYFEVMNVYHDTDDSNNDKKSNQRLTLDTLLLSAYCFVHGFGNFTIFGDILQYFSYFARSRYVGTPSNWLVPCFKRSLSLFLSAMYDVYLPRTHGIGIDCKLRYKKYSQYLRMKLSWFRRTIIMNRMGGTSWEIERNPYWRLNHGNLQFSVN